MNHLIIDVSIKGPHHRKVGETRSCNHMCNLAADQCANTSGTGKKMITPDLMESGSESSTKEEWMKSRNIPKYRNCLSYLVNPFWCIYRLLAPPKYLEAAPGSIAPGRTAPIRLCRGMIKWIEAHWFKTLLSNTVRLYLLLMYSKREAVYLQRFHVSKMEKSSPTVCTLMVPPMSHVQLYTVLRSLSLLHSFHAHKDHKKKLISHFPHLDRGSIALQKADWRTIADQKVALVHDIHTYISDHKQYT